MMPGNKMEMTGETRDGKLRDGFGPPILTYEPNHTRQGRSGTIGEASSFASVNMDASWMARSVVIRCSARSSQFEAD